jgi:hypothetical protein
MPHGFSNRRTADRGHENGREKDPLRERSSRRHLPRHIPNGCLDASAPKVLHAIEILGSVVSAIVMNAGDQACPETSPPVLTPVPAVGNQLELLLEKRMVRMC